jgi:hypothetical protein
VYSLILILAVILAVPALSACSSTTGSVAATTATVETEIYGNNNIAGVLNNPTGGPTTFTVSDNYRVTLLMDYHWNNGQGALAGTIGLKDSSGKVIGTWPVTVSSGVYWDVTPNINIGPGTYTVVDSDPATWAQNSQSENKGITVVKGLAITYAASPGTTTGSSNSTASGSAASIRTGDITTGPEVDAAAHSIDAAGGIVGVSKPGDALDGFAIDVPPGSYSSNTAFKVSYASITGQTFGSDITPVSPMISVDNGGAYSDQIMYVTVPVKVPDDDFAMGFIYDATTKQLEGMPLEAVDADSVTVGTTHFSNFFVGMISRALLTNDIGTKFQPGKDDWQFTNYGSYIAQGGHCEGQSLTALWYYVTKPDGANAHLYGRYDNNGNQPATPDLWQDDSLGYRFCSVVQSDIKFGDFANTFWINLGGEAVKKVSGVWKLVGVPGKGDEATWNLFAYTMLATHEPQLVAVRSSAGGGHAMIVYGISGGNLLVADPNYPGNTERVINYADGKFTPYNSGANKADIDAGNGTAYDIIDYLGKSTVLSWASIAQRWTELQQGNIGNIGTSSFPTYQIIWLDDKNVSHPLTDGYVSPNKLININTIVNNIKAGEKSATAVYRDGKVLPWDANGNYELLPGVNKLGIYVCAKVPKVDKKGNAYMAAEYVDFKYINVIYNSATTTDSGMLAILQTKTIFTCMLDLHGVLTEQGTENPGTYPDDHQAIQVDAIGLKWNGASFTANTKAGTTGTVSGTMSPDGNTLLNLTVNITQPDGSFIEKCSYNISNLPVKWVKNGGVYSSGIAAPGLNTYIGGFSWQETDSKDTLSFAPDWTDKTNSLNIYFNP